METFRPLANKKALSLAALLASNLLPLAGVYFWEWDVGAIIVLYWSENLILGAFSIGKMIALKPIRGTFSSLFFLLHYGGFCAVHGLFVIVLATDSQAQFMDGEPWPLFLVFLQLLISVIRQVLEIAPPQWWWGFAALTVSHGLSLLLNYIGKGEYRLQSLKKLSQDPYKRIFVLHIALFVGAYGIVAVGSPLALLVMLVFGKLGLDIWLHLREHAGSTIEPTARQA